MRDLLFLAADLALVVAGLYYGWQFLRRYGNHLLALEWLVIGSSATNFLLWALLGGSEDSPLYDLAYALDAFSRSFGATLILVIGLLAVTHRWRPPEWVEVGATGLAVAGAVAFGGLHSDTDVVVPLAVFYVVTNLLTAGFLLWFAARLWAAGARPQAVLTAVVTALGSYIAVTYDFFPWSFDDADRTLFYTAALSTWAAQGVVYFQAYRALHDHHARTDAAAGARVEVSA